VLSLALTSGAAANAAQSTPVPAQAAAPAPQDLPAVSPADLNRQINDVIHERKYAWRMPRQAAVEPDSEKGVLTRFLQQLTGLARDTVRTVRDWLESLLRKVFKPVESNPGGSGFSWTSSLLLYAAIAAVVTALALFFYRLWRGPKPAVLSVAVQGVQRAPDISDENVSADQLPEDGWTKLARGLLQAGDFRLAMRAFYLATLAHLAQRDLIGIADFKSNRDYENELRRRGHAIPELLPIFGENLSIFECVWYGMHDVDRELVDRFAVNVDKIKAAA